MRNKFTTIINILMGNAFAQLIIILTTPILTRIYTPNDFGTLAIANGVILTLGVVGCMRYDQLFFKYSDKCDWEKCYTNAMFISNALSITMLLLLFIISIFINTNIDDYIISLPILILTFSLSQLYSSILSVTSQYTKITNSVMIRSIFIFLSQYSLFYTIEHNGLIYGLVFGQICQCLYLMFYAKKAMKLEYNSNLIEYPCKDSITSTIQSFFNSFSSQLPSLFIPYKFGLELMGYYSMALRLTYMPITFLSNALRPFILGELNKNKNEQKKILRILMFGSTGLLLLSFIGIFLINSFARQFFVFYAGDDWSISGDIASILSFWIMLAFSNILSTSYLTVFSKFKQLLIYDASLLILRAIIVWITYYIGFDFFEFIKLYSCVGFIFNFSIIIYTIWLAKNEKNLYRYDS